MTSLSSIDLVVFGVYISAMILIGLWGGRKKKVTAAEFFITNKALPWYIIGFSFIAATVSAQQLIGSVGFSYRYGLAVANWEWLNGFAILLLVFIFVPFYIRKKIVTMPQFLGLRYDRATQRLFAYITLLTYIFINLAGVIYSGAFALHAIFGINIGVGIWSLAVIAGVFTIYGGMESVAWTNVLQSVLLLLSGVLIFILGWYALPGGWAQIIGSGERSQLLLPSSHPDLPGTGLFVLMVSTNVWFFCTNQSINQSSLGARNEWHAKMGVLMVGFLSLFVAVADVFPGMIAYALNPNLERPDESYIYLVNTLVPAGARGLFFAVLCGGTITAIEALVNASSTILTLDIYQKHFPETDQKKLIAIGRLGSLMTLTIGALWAPVVARFDYIFSYFQECWAFIAIPAAVIFVMGILWKGVTAKAAWVTLCLSFPMLLLPYVLRLANISTNVYHVAALVLIFTTFFCWVVSVATKSDAEVSGARDEAVWKFSMTQLPSSLFPNGYPWYKRVSFWAIGMVVIYVLLYASLVGNTAG
ncbi:sodium/solute symporter [Chryseolinea sp. H1M3-3]|uniref:SLC5 family protein n=1 Tax=Chryseolinea sp. H1M3-3 TaxID=3034144 RepID=UPI0023EC8BAC|nr:sodium/solute symporter [Chryseolinea sp. H1M3-3]